MASAGITLNSSHQFRLDAGLSPSPESILIYLAVLGSPSVPMRVLESDSIASVKLRIQNCSGFVVKKQKLVFNGHELARNDCLVKDYGVSDGNVLHLVIRISDLRAISVKTSCGKKFKFHNDAVIHLLVRKSFSEKERKEVSIEPVVVNPKIEIPPVIKNLVRSVMDGLEKGNPPVMSSEGTGGAYFMQDASGRDYVAVFKPADEEPLAENNPRGLPVSTDGEGLKRGTRVGEGAMREVAAYILDHPIKGGDVGFSGVPPTVMARCLDRGFYHPNGFDHEEMRFKIGSLQMFVKNCGSCEDMGPRAFPVEEVHKICVLDIRLANADRHAGNILFCKEGDEGRTVLVPIDHGYCLPENFEDCTFEWLYWPQSREPFNSETIQYIKSLDAEQDIELLKLHGWKLSLECSRTLRISTMLLKKGVEMGLTPYDIGSIMCRETVKKESKIEQIIREAKDNALADTIEDVLLESVAEIMDHHLNELTN